MVGAYTLEQHEKLFDVMGFDDSLTETDKADEFYHFKREQDLRTALRNCFEKQHASHWEEVLNQHDVPAARVRDLYEILNESQSKRNPDNQYARLNDNPMTMPIAAFSYQQDGPEFDAYCARHGEDTEAVLREIGITSNRIKDLRGKKVI